VLWFHEAKSLFTVQRLFVTFGKEPPHEISIFKWFNLLEGTGYFRKRGEGSNVTEVQVPKEIGWERRACHLAISFS